MIISSSGVSGFVYAGWYGIGPRILPEIDLSADKNKGCSFNTFKSMWNFKSKAQF